MGDRARGEQWKHYCTYSCSGDLLSTNFVPGSETKGGRQCDFRNRYWNKWAEGCVCLHVCFCLCVPLRACVCSCVSVSCVSEYMCVSLCAPVCICVCVCTCVCESLCVCVWKCACVCISVCVCPDVCLCTCACVGPGEAAGLGAAPQTAPDSELFRIQCTSCSGRVDAKSRGSEGLGTMKVMFLRQRNWLNTGSLSQALLQGRLHPPLLSWCPNPKPTENGFLHSWLEKLQCHPIFLFSFFFFF